MAFSSRRDLRDEVGARVGNEAQHIFIESPSATASSCRPQNSSLSSRSSVWVKGIRGTKSAPEWAMKPDAFLSNPPKAPTPRSFFGRLSSDNDGNISSREVVSDVKFEKETHVKDIEGECPVCLSVFADGKEVKQLSVCKHSFHAPCIDLWLSSHSNCPVCRASIAVKRPKVTASARDEDNQQGLLDASALV
ncbi:RING-H2 finger protein ATL33-like [Carya illinoinensis]|uniref:RING-type domain-containing protein n=1 Tax=Carya illinoinensis TaxID=32201 RepID=A0A8T1P867_CARIL|nr:RING-H2 finger protein ATL33-like [Carya illinoinensis]KAG6640836.1 hypothetical protein CIPAW_09G031400 [Carya illinoinensis]